MVFMFKNDTILFMCLKGHQVDSVQNGSESQARLEVGAVIPVGLPYSPGNGDGEKWTDLRETSEAESIGYGY